MVLRRARFGDLRFETRLFCAFEDRLYRLEIARRNPSIAFSCRPEVFSGSGVNVYSSNVWGTPGRLEVARDDLFAVRLVRRLFRLTPAQRRSLEPLRRMVARRLGLAEGEHHAELDFLASTETVQRSWERFSETPAYDELVAKWPDSDGGELEDLLGFGWRLFGSTRRLALSVTTRGEPHWTNGSWDEAASRVLRKLEIPGPRGLPVLCYATWAEPDESAQGARFGRVALRGRALLDYAFWYSGLTPEEQRRWDAQLARLDLSRALAPQLEALVLPGEALSDPRELIAAGLDE